MAATQQLRTPPMVLGSWPATPHPVPGRGGRPGRAMPSRLGFRSACVA